MRRSVAAPGLAALAALLVALPGCVARRAATGPEVTPMALVWHDEFDGPAGQLPDTASTWRFDVGTNWGNDQLEYDTERPENCSMDGQGHLRITARREDWLGCAYTSARINTRGRFEHARGRFEASIRLPSGQGLWPAFWLLGSDLGAVGWPACGEIDVMEYRGQEPRIVHGSLHGPGYSGGGALTSAFSLPAGSPDFDRGFHLFSVDWEPGRITWRVDGIAYKTVTPDQLPPGAPWVFEHPFFVILNVAVGGNFVGGPGPGTTFPQTMSVDYVRVYADAP